MNSSGSSSAVGDDGPCGCGSSGKSRANGILFASKSCRWTATSSLRHRKQRQRLSRGGSGTHAAKAASSHIAEWVAASAAAATACSAAIVRCRSAAALCRSAETTGDAGPAPIGAPIRARGDEEAAAPPPGREAHAAAVAVEPPLLLSSLCLHVRIAFCHSVFCLAFSARSSSAPPPPPPPSPAQLTCSRKTCAAPLRLNRGGRPVKGGSGRAGKRAVPFSLAKPTDVVLVLVRQIL